MMSEVVREDGGECSSENRVGEWNNVHQERERMGRQGSEDKGSMRGHGGERLGVFGVFWDW